MDEIIDPLAVQINVVAENSDSQKWPDWAFRITRDGKLMAMGRGYSGEDGEKQVWAAVSDRIRDYFLT